MGFITTILKNPDKDPDYWYREGKDLSSRGYYLDALEALDRMLAVDPLHADSWLIKGHVLYQMGKYEEGLQFFDQALIINPGLYEALTYKGLIYSNFGRHTEALELYDRALAVNASYTNAWYVKGLTLAIGEKFDAAIQCYEKALAIEPKHTDSLAGISIAMKKREKGNGERFASPVRGLPPHHSDTVLTPPPTRVEPHPDHAIFMPFPKGAKFPEVMATVPGKCKADPFPGISPVKDVQERPPTRQLPLPTPAPRTSYDEMIQGIKGILVTNPLDAKSWCTLGDLYLRSGKYPLATEAYEHALDCNEENATAWAALGDARKKMGAYDEALFAYERALGIDQLLVVVWIAKAKTLAMLSRYEDAISSCDQAIALDETCIDAWLYKGFLFKKISRYTDALYAYDQVLAINPCHDHAVRQRRTLSDGA